MKVDSGSSPGSQSTCTVQVENLGGIGRTELSLPPGVSLLVGRNATNRSSFLRALSAALGARISTPAPKTDADEGTVTLSVDGREYGRRISRRGSTVQTDGSPYTDEAALVDGFVTLFPDSPARRAVWQGTDLRDVLMEPVDTAAIREQIDELRTRQEELTDTIDRIEAEERELPDLTARKRTLEENLADLEEEIEDRRSLVAELERQSTTGDEDDEATAYREQLETLRDDLASAERTLEEINSTISYREGERKELVAELDELQETVDSGTNIGAIREQKQDLERRIERLEAKRDGLERTAEDLQSVIQVNERFLSDDGATFVQEAENPAAALDPASQTIECWTCGTAVEHGRVTDRLDTLRELVADHRSELREVEATLADLRTEHATYEDQIASLTQTQERIQELEARIDGHEGKIGDLEDQRVDQESRVEQIEADIEAVESALQSLDTDDDETSEFIEAHQELSTLERERGQTESQLSQVTEEIDRIESLTADRTAAREELAAVRDEMADLRGRIDEIETDLVETTNEVMADLIELLEYRNIARVWIERKGVEDGAESTFDLHVVRETADGTVYEDSVETLSESEREVIGIVVALVGYIVHDVPETVPFLLLDSVEMIDGERLARLLEYVREETAVTFLAVALLPKDAEAVEAAGALAAPSTIPFGESPS